MEKAKWQGIALGAWRSVVALVVLIVGAQFSGVLPPEDASKCAAAARAAAQALFGW